MRKMPDTSIVDQVARDVVASQFRGCAMGTLGMYIDRDALRREAEKVPLDELIDSIRGKKAAITKGTP